VRRGYCLAHFASMSASMIAGTAATTDNLINDRPIVPPLGRASTIATPTSSSSSSGNHSRGSSIGGMAPTPRNSVIGQGPIALPLPIASIASLAAARLASSTSTDSNIRDHNNDDTPRTIAQQRYLNDEADANDIDTVYTRIQRGISGNSITLDRNDSTNSHNDHLSSMLDDYEANERARLILLAEQRQRDEDDNQLISPITPPSSIGSVTSSSIRSSGGNSNSNSTNSSGGGGNGNTDPRAAFITQGRQRSFNGTEQAKPPTFQRVQSDRRAIIAHQQQSAPIVSGPTQVLFDSL
jgi:hypothetical protein